LDLREEVGALEDLRVQVMQMLESLDAMEIVPAAVAELFGQLEAKWDQPATLGHVPWSETRLFLVRLLRVDKVLEGEAVQSVGATGAVIELPDEIP
jgi:hypothetical protein